MENRKESKQKSTNNLKAKRQRCEIWTRVMGYYRPTQSFNLGKKQEYKQRKNFIYKDDE